MKIQKFSFTTLAPLILLMFCSPSRAQEGVDTTIADTVIDSVSDAEILSEDSVQADSGFQEMPLHLERKLIYDSLGDILGGDFDWPEIDSSVWTTYPKDTAAVNPGAFVIESHYRVWDHTSPSESRVQKYNRYRVTNDDGKSVADFKGVFIYRDSAEIPNLRARVVYSNGNTFDLDSNSIVREVTEITDGFFEVHVSYSLPQVTSDCIIDHYQSYIDRSGEQRTWRFQSELPTLKASCYWYPSHFRPVTWDEFVNSIVTYRYMNFTVQFPTAERHMPDKRGNVHIWMGPYGEGESRFKSTERVTGLKFSVKDVPAFSAEPMSLPGSIQSSRLVFFRSDESKRDKYWIDLGNDGREYIAEFCKKNSKLNDVLKDIKANVEPKYWLDSAYTWVQRSILNLDLRSWSSESVKAGRVFTGGRRDKTNYDRADNVNDVVKKECGYPTEIALTFLQLARSLGYHANLAFVCDREESVFIEDLHTWQFDRPLVRTEIDSTVVWFDPYTPFLPPGELEWNCQGVTAFTIFEDTIRFLQTPFSNSTVNKSTLVVDIRDVSIEGWSGRTRIVATGCEAASLRRKLWPLGNESREVEFLKTLGKSKSSIDSITISGLLSCDSAVTIEYWQAQEISGALAGGKVLASLRDFVPEQTIPFLSSKRTQPIIFDYPYRIQTVLRFELPEGWTASAGGSWDKVENYFGSGQAIFTSMGQQVSVQLAFNLHNPIGSSDLYPDVKSLFEWRQAIMSAAIAFQTQ